MVPPTTELPVLPEKLPEVEPPEVEPVVVETSEDPPVQGSGLPGEDPTPETEADPMAIDPGFLNIRAEPRAVIFLNGKNLGQTPLERIELSPGEHTFKAVAPGKRAQVRTVRVDSGQAQRIIFRF
jgi:serine/threonine-protein kinase